MCREKQIEVRIIIVATEERKIKLNRVSKCVVHLAFKLPDSVDQNSLNQLSHIFIVILKLLYQ